MRGKPFLFCILTFGKSRKKRLFSESGGADDAGVVAEFCNLDAGLACVVSRVLIAVDQGKQRTDQVVLFIADPAADRKQMLIMLVMPSAR